MSRRYAFFQKILTQLNEVQTALNTIRATIKEHLKDEQRKISGEA